MRDRLGLAAWLLLGLVTATAAAWVASREPVVGPAWATDPGNYTGGGCKGC